MQIKSPKASRLLFLPFIVAILIVAAFPKWTVDDAYISYRYGANLVEAGELTWNPGNQPVEGYTGVLLPLLAACFRYMQIDPASAMQLLGLLCFATTILCLFLILKSLGVNREISLLSAGFYALGPSHALHLYSGLETSLFVSLLALTGLALLQLQKRLSIQSQPSPGHLLPAFLFSILMLLCGLCRPEGWAYALALITGLWFSTGRFQWPPVKVILVLVSGFLIPTLLYHGWRYHYYGDWLPNTWYAKSFAGLLNVESIKAFIRWGGLYLLLPVAGAGFLLLAEADRLKAIAARPLLRHPLTRTWLISSIVFSCLLLLSYFRSNLYMNYGDRFFYPLFLFGATGFGLLANQSFLLYRKTSQSHPFRKRLLKRAALALVVIQAGLFAVKLKQEWYFAAYYKSIMEDEYFPAANYIRQHIPANGNLICYMDAGVTGYLNKVAITDFGRLNDPYLAKGKPSPEAVIDYFFSQNAAAVVFTSEAFDRFSYLDEAHAIQEDPRFGRYKLVRKFNNSFGYDYFQFVYFDTLQIRP